MSNQSPFKTITIFYSWQSDRPEACCKRFIRIAAEEASAAVATRLGIKIIVDSDTEGVAGTPPISETILRKIESCDLFLADMTFVGETAESKLLPNPNVMGEYGYALHAKTAHRILLAMNTEFGPPDALPFDLRHMRYPAQYSLAENAPDSERRSTRKRFSNTLERNIEAAIGKLLQAPTVDADQWGAAESALHALQTQSIAFPDPVIVSGPKLVVSIVPLAALGLSNLPPLAVKAARSHFPPSADTKVKEGVDETHWWTSGVWHHKQDRPNPETDWLFRLTSRGLIQVQTTIGHRIDDDPDILVSGKDIEAYLVNAVDRAANVCEATGLGGPALVNASLEQIEDVEICRASGSASRLRKRFARMGTLRVHQLKAPTADNLKPLLDKMWLIGGWDDGSPFFNAGHWVGYD